MLTTVEKKPSKKAQTPEVPEFLVKEVIDGVSYYYKNYREVLNKTKTPEEIIGCSGLQSLILEYFVFNVCVLVDRKKYRIFTNEPGNHLGPNNNVSYDIAIFDRSVLVPEKIDIHYVDVPPKMILEVDVRIELIDTKFATAEEYIFMKTGKVLDFGVERLIWILSQSGKLVVAEKGKTWEIFNWDEEIEFMNGIKFNIARYLKEEGVNLET